MTSTPPSPDLPPPAFTPGDLPAQRWSGEGLELPPGTLLAHEEAALTALYRELESVYREWLGNREVPDWEALGAGVRSFARPPLSDLLDHFSRSTRERESGLSPLVRRALHDLRGGAFFALRLHAELLEEEAPEPDQVETGIFLARDQAKVIRSLVSSVDPDGYERDRTERPHGMRELVDKWQGFAFHQPGGAVTVRVLEGWRGDLAARCLEAAALDRVVYNLVNNAARFAAGGEVVLQVDRASVAAARFTVSNGLDAEQTDWLSRKVGGDAGALFLGGETRGGSGVGMSSGASIVARAWGLLEARDALEAGAVGARHENGTFTTWFHWPILARIAPAGALG